MGDVKEAAKQKRRMVLVVRALAARDPEALKRWLEQGEAAAFRNSSSENR